MAPWKWGLLSMFLTLTSALVTAQMTLIVFKLNGVQLGCQ